MEINTIHLDKIDSTSNFAHLLLSKGEELPDLTIIEAEDQIAGRGQVGNSWETEKGKNVIFSLVCHPTWVHPADQYVLSECIALAVVKALERETLPNPPCLGREKAALGTPSLSREGRGGSSLSVKWPNDIYYGNKKISGTLIECDIMGKGISNCIVGTGVNINQQVFRSDAPNPISLYNILGKECDKEQVLLDIVDEFSVLYDRVRQGEAEQIHKEYKNRLYRNDGKLYKYSDAQGEFLARIIDVEPSGRLILETETGERRRYEFKEVKFILS